MINAEEGNNSTFEVSALAKKIKSREKYAAKMFGPISDVDFPE